MLISLGEFLRVVEAVKIMFNHDPFTASDLVTFDVCSLNQGFKNVDHDALACIKILPNPFADFFVSGELDIYLP